MKNNRSERRKRGVKNLFFQGKTDGSAIQRTVIQLIFLVMAPGVWSSSFAGLKSSLVLIRQGEPLALTSGSISFLLLCVMTVLTGRFFCGQICAFGTLGDWVHSLARICAKRCGKKLPELSARMAHRLKYGKFAVLLLILLTCFTGHDQQIHGNSPWDAYGQLLSGAPVLEGYEWGYVLLAVLLVGMALIPRFFCRFLCPLGAVFALLPPSVVVKLKKPAGEIDGKRPCGSCTLCSRQCPVSLKLNPMDTIDDGECIRCGRCLHACYQKKPFYSVFGLRIPKAAVFWGMMLFFLLAFLLLDMTRF